MLDLVIPMGAVLLSWLLFFLLFSGLGIFMLRLLRRRLDSGTLMLDAFWLGWSLTLALLQIWHFAFPVNDWALAILSVLALALLLSQRRALRQILLRLKSYRSFLLVYGLLALWMSNRALGMPAAYDTGFRDLQAVMWIDSYPIIPGLGNLFASLAYNQSAYLYDALLDTSIWSGRAHYIATGLLLMVYLAYALHAARQALRHRSGAGLRWSWLFATFTIPYVMHYTVALGGITHFLTDTVVDLLGFLTMIYLLDFLQDLDAPSDALEFGFLRLALLVAVGMTVKQTFIVFGLTAGFVATAVWLRAAATERDRARKGILLLVAGAWALALILPWMLRGVVTSGYPAYPHGIGRVEADWAIPPEHIEIRQFHLAANTRFMDGNKAKVLASWDWLKPWLERLSQNVMTTILPLLVTAGSLPLYIAGAWRKPRKGRAQTPGAIALLPVILALIVWFFSYPNDKYIRYVFWTCAALSLILSLCAWNQAPWPIRILILFAATALAMGLVLYSIVRNETWPLGAGPDQGFYTRPSPSIREFETDSGLKLNAPEGRIAQCWQIPLPCTPYTESNLALRVPGDMASGFRLEAEATGERSDA